MKKQLHNIFLYLAVVVLASVLVQKCSDNHDLRDNLSVVIGQKDSLRSVVTRGGELVSLQSQIIVEKDKQLIDAVDEIKYLKSLDSQVKVVTHIEVPTYIPLVYHDTTVVIDSIPVFRQQIKFQNQYLILGLHVIDQRHAFLDSLKLVNTTTVQLGTKKHFLKADSHEVLIHHSNPYFKTAAVSNYVFVEKPKWYELGAVKFGIGFLAGILIK